MRYGSLCSGIGGLDLAVEAVFGAAPAWFCEADPHARTVLERHWPGVPIWPDLKTQDWSTVEPVDLVCAGYPCQPFSFAGRREGAEDPRHLWPYVIAAVRLLGPRYVVLENVAGHLGLGFDAVLGDLAEAGFDAEWTTLRASDIGACHRRERLFVVAHASGAGAGLYGTTGGRGGQASGPHRPALLRSGDGSACADRTSTDGSASADATGPRCPRAEDPGADHRHEGADGRRSVQSERSRGNPTADPDRGRLEGSGQPDGDQAGGEPASRRANPDRRCPAPADAYGQAGRQPRGSGEAVPQPRQVERSGRCPGVAWGPYEPAVRRWEAVVGRDAPAPTDERGRLAVPFVEWMMGFDSGWVDGLSRSAALRCLGNAVVPKQGAAALAILSRGRDEGSQR